MLTQDHLSGRPKVLIVLRESSKLRASCGKSKKGLRQIPPSAPNSANGRGAFRLLCSAVGSESQAPLNETPSSRTAHHRITLRLLTNTYGLVVSGAFLHADKWPYCTRAQLRCKISIISHRTIWLGDMMRILQAMKRTGIRIRALGNSRRPLPLAGQTLRWVTQLAALVPSVRMKE